MDDCTRRQLIDLIKREVVLATGCTEPVAVALCATKAREVLGREPEKVELFLSKNVYKNAMGVGIPGTGMIGLPIAVAIGIVAGDSDRQLEVLNVDEYEVLKAKRWLERHTDDVSIGVKVICDKLYIECVCKAGEDTARAIISGRHTNFTLVEKNGVKNHSLTQDADSMPCGEDEEGCCKLSVEKVLKFAITSPIDELRFIQDTVRYNAAAAEEGKKGYGLCVGKILMEANRSGDTVHTVVSNTVAASDARMDGCTMPVYSNSGSGNQGICCTLPVYEYAKITGIDEERMIRALIISHLMSIYVKQGIGRLSALCGIVNASIGVASAITYLQGGGYEQVCYAVKNLINTIAGMVCDGAKPSCALKMSTGLYSAFVSAELACHDKVVDATDGLSERDVDCSISNLGRLGHDGMNETDDVVLDIMTHKKM
ncbi:MAG: L-serine ammonia-lyase, iron-sulfur-dependent, subunit alpha [Bacteroidales bacterium]|nr:L-serine ammonia-lyase, iron-sulfur-dependent, subunit alpha [Bacteroidales bacterium]